MTMLRFISFLLTVATVDATMTDCDVYQRSWNIIAHYNKADLSVKQAEIHFPTTDPPLFSEDLVINMGSMTVTGDQYLEAYNDVTIKSMQANPTWVECSPWEWCHMHLMTTYYGPDGGGSISLRQFWTFVFNTDCRVTKFIILMEARDNDILSTAFGTGPATEL
jgi:hypothetical protein